MTALMRDRRLATLSGTRVLARFLSPRDMSALTKYVYLSDVLRQHQIVLVLDVGANVGQFGQALRAIGYRGQIVSFEPDPQSFRKLADAAAGDDSWDALETAVGDEEAVAELLVTSSSVFSSLHKPLSSPATEQFSTEITVDRREPVTIRRLDALVDELKLRPLLSRTLLKSDTQGHDREVLSGMSRLSEIALIQIEMNSLSLYEDAPTMAEMLDYTGARGFAPVQLSALNHASDGSATEFDYLGVNRRDGTIAHSRGG